MNLEIVSIKFAAMQKPKRTVVVGGGAAGFFAAINLKEFEPDREVIILEKSQKLLSKVRVSGGGRCNVTHACFDPTELVRNYPRGERELKGPFHFFDTSDCIAWFSKRGIELKGEEDGRMFPSTDSSETIIDCFLSEAKKKGVSILMGTAVQSIKKNNKWKLLLSTSESMECDSLIIAIGGNSKATHYQLVEELGHRIVPPIPSLFSFNLKKEKLNSLLGISVNACVRIQGTDSEECGPLLITHWGLSGPAILKLSSKEAVYLHKKNYFFNFSIEWMASAKEWLDEKRSSDGAKLLLNVKPNTIPKRLWIYLLDRAGLDEKFKLADMNKAQIDAFTELMEKDLYQAKGKTTFKEEFVTCGGVDLKEINFKNMQSKIHEDLYFAGEFINIDALTGGFNFQAAWTTSWLAAKGISEKNKL